MTARTFLINYMYNRVECIAISEALIRALCTCILTAVERMIGERRGEEGAVERQAVLRRQSSAHLAVAQHRRRRRSRCRRRRRSLARLAERYVGHAGAAGQHVTHGGCVEREQWRHVLSTQHNRTHRALRLVLMSTYMYAVHAQSFCYLISCRLEMLGIILLR